MLSFVFCFKSVCCIELIVVLNPYNLQIQELFHIKFHKTLFSPFLLQTYFWGFHTRELNHAMCSVANNGRSSAIADRLGALVDKKNLETTKMTDHFSHVQKKGFKTAKTKRSLFLLISLFNST